MYQKVSIFVLLVVIGMTNGGTVKSNSRCILPISGQSSFFAPLFFDDVGKLLNTATVLEVNEDLVLNGGEQILLSCSPNFFRNYQQSRTLNATCVDGLTLHVNGDNVNYLEELSCELRPIEEVMKTVYGCSSQDQRGVHYGYTNPITEQSFVLGESCYSTKEGRTIFAHTKLRSGDNSVEKMSLKVEDITYFTGAHPNNRPQIEFLRATNALTLQTTLEDLLGRNDNLPSFKVQRYFDLELLGHKQYSSALKFAWNNFIVNNFDGGESNIDVLNSDIKQLGVENLEVYSGSHGVVTMKNRKQGKDVPMFLRPNKYPVPKIIWTIVKTDERATAFGVFNSPTVTEQEIASVCESKCTQITWITNLLKSDQYMNKGMGYVVCCDVSKFRQTVTEVPDLVEVIKLFK